MKKFAVILSGCGVFDGSEIQEAVLTLLAIKKNGATYQVFAPDILQHDVVNHFNGKTMGEQRNVLTESARIARGKVFPLQKFDAKEFDALIIPGGFGCAKNLSTWAFEGDHCSVNPDLEKAISEMHLSGKPVGALCIAPVILAGIIPGTRLTTGNDKASGDFIRKKGSSYITTTHGEVVSDKEKKIFSTPCYMLDADIVQISEGAENIVKEMMNVM
jgi:enhancing lycopene biosynthesis protein 2